MSKAGQANSGRGKRAARAKALSVRRVSEARNAETVDLSQPGPRAAKVARLVAKLDRLRARRIDVEARVCVDGVELDRRRRELARIDGEMGDAEAELKAVREERRALRAAGDGDVSRLKLRLGRAGAGGRSARDPFALVCARSSVLTDWHYRVGDGLRALAEAAICGGSGGLAVSGRAGDGDGREGGRADEAFWGGLGLPGVAARSERVGKAPRARRAKGVKAARPVSDGGMAARADAMRRAARVWSQFVETAEAYGREVGGRVGCGLACAAVIRGDSGLDAARTRFLKGRKAEVLDLLEAAMAVGLEAVSGRVEI